MHRNDRRRGQPIAELGEILGRHDVEAADDRPAGLRVGNARNAETGGRVDDAEIDAELVEPVIQHLRHHRGGAVARIGGLPSPIALHRGAARFALLYGLAQRIGDAALRGDEAVRPLVADHLAHALGEDRRVLDPVAVAIDDRVADLFAGFLGMIFVAGAHAVLPRGSLALGLL